MNLVPLQNEPMQNSVLLSYYGMIPLLSAVQQISFLYPLFPAQAKYEHNASLRRQMLTPVQSDLRPSLFPAHSRKRFALFTAIHDYDVSIALQNERAGAESYVVLLGG